METNQLTNQISNQTITAQTFKPKSKLKHNYTTELELKSLIIRIKNKRKNLYPENEYLNSRINKYICWYILVNQTKYTQDDKKLKRSKLKSKLKEKIVHLSEITPIDVNSYENFGSIIMLMIKNILTKPQFSGYTYKDDFYSDAIFKIIKYLHNFDHNLISDRTGLPGNAFAYISQYIHNSILFIIECKKKESKKLKKQVILEHLGHDLQLKSDKIWAQDHFDEQKEQQKIIDNSEITETVILEKIDDSLYKELINLKSKIDESNRIEIIYPKSYKITFEEYNILRDLLKCKVNLIKSKV